MKIKIITDTTSDLPIEYGEKIGVAVLPIGIEIDGEFYKEGIDIKPPEFYEKLRNAKTLPHTSQINEYDFTQEIEKNANTGCFFCLINISKELSNTYYQSQLAAKNFPSENIYICDSQTTSVGLGMLVEHAVFLSKKQDMTPENFIAELELFKDKIAVFGMISDLKYLKMGGRLSSGAAFIGSMLKINPLVTIDGKIKVISKHMGSKRAFVELAKILSNRNLNYPMYIAHSDCKEFMNEMFEKEKETIKLDMRERYFDIGAAIGTHIGSGAIAVAFIKEYFFTCSSFYLHFLFV